MSPSRISILLPDLRGGGAERVAVNLANGFVARGHAIDMVLMKAEGQFLADLDASVRVVDLNAKRLRNVFFPLVRYLRAERPTAMLASMWPLTLLALWAGWVARGGTRMVLAEHTTWSRAEIIESPSVRWQVQTSMHWMFPKANHVVAVSRGAADDLARFANISRQCITVIYNPIVGDEMASDVPCAPPDGWWNGTHRKVLAVGTLKHIKDYPTLLRAFQSLSAHTEARLLILGEGPCREALEAQVRQLGLEGRVFMPGFVKDPAPYFAHADLHVLSSTGEGFGNVIVEALQAGTPVVCTDCESGPREILCDGRYGGLVPVGDAQALARAMALSLATHHDPAALKARAQDFSIDKAVVQYEALLLGE